MKNQKFKITEAHKKVRVVWDRKPFEKIKESKKKYKRNKKYEAE